MNPFHTFLKDLVPILGGFKGKVILDVGCELKGDLVRCLTEDYQAQAAVGINPIAPPLTISDCCEVIPGDIRKTEFADATFDLIISSCAFEHIPNLDRALVEMNRILKPGGFIYSHHGPIWSTLYGHHIYLPGGNTYWKIILPPWCHLLMLEPELAEWLSKTYDPPSVKLILDWVYRDPGQNRLMYSDHVRIYHNSPLEVCFCYGYTHPELSDRYLSLMSYDLIEKLKSRFPNHEGFFYEGINLNPAIETSQKSRR
ncbi:MAG: class I SAM-dependent methyltransferase [Opitutus sp.]|nr:class I SAM-dependent methyltransferase [Opitutus sp.]MCS6245373.1 class I SAM-dependent methyltransferase [Opitutus sp.]MCS6246626.1 class I SAM-dependent methyltransferase [Opitutus sp.]MCS6274806.1 class I SAM-dependent methyltransferase [Opitutus sp.]MCS6276098.1 class I SAM-dependent methyltransferase [Opitutus sp.]